MDCCPAHLVSISKDKRKLLTFRLATGKLISTVQEQQDLAYPHFLTVDYHPHHRWQQFSIVCPLMGEPGKERR
jgi:hypothetical protein